MKRFFIIFFVSFLVFQNSLFSNDAIYTQEKEIIGTIEIVPNYLIHLFIIGEVWKDNKKNNPEYHSKYSKYVIKEDIDYIRSNRNFIAWGTGQTGPLTSILFFLPARITNDKTEMEKYFHLVQDCFIEKENFKHFNETYPESAVPDGFIDDFWKVKDNFKNEFFKLSDIVLRNYDAYEKNVWPIERKKLEDTARLLTEKFKGTRSIEKWENHLKQKFPGDKFEIVLTTANLNAPSANNLGPTRYNFYYNPGHLDGLIDLIHHEIGTNLLEKSMNKLKSDINLAKKIKASGENTSVIWRAFESLAEFYKAKLFNTKRNVWKGVLFGGEKYYFNVFFEIYDKEYRKNPELSSLEMMRKGVESFLEWKQKQ